MSPLISQFLQLPATAIGVASWVLLALSTYVLLRFIYNVFFHPLAGYPGPLLYRGSDIPILYHMVNGTVSHKIADMHEKYGSVVRVGINELCYISPQAWIDVYGQRPGQGQMPKAQQKGPAGFDAVNMISASAEVHARHRRTLAHAFSDKALREQEPLIKQYVDLLMQRLREKNGEKLDLTAWFNYCTFDLIGDLAFGESFNCLRDSQYHPWITLIFSNLKVLAWSTVFSKVPGLEQLMLKLAPTEVIEQSKEHVELCKRQANKRLAQGENVSRPDFMSYIIRHNSKDTGLSIAEIQADCYVIIIGGSETTATLLSGAVYYLLRNPTWMGKLKTEIRTAFKSQDEITFTSVSALPTLLAVLNESLRIYPPVPSKLPRGVPAGGAVVDGKFVPAGTAVSVCQWAASRSAMNFKDPTQFRPERWMGDPRYEGDRKEAMQPFSYGPRNCIGRNLAYMEMRLILTRLLWEFDLELCKESEGWEKQKVFVLWEKPSLWVRCTSVKRDNVPR